jgi:CheY-like chemotaxis protein
MLEAGSGGAALDLVEREPNIDLMIADFAMPGMNGAEVARLQIGVKPLQSQPRRIVMSQSEVLQGLDVLVVEDESMICLLLEDMLKDLGCKVVGMAGNFKHAVELAERERIDVAILDVNLGGQLVFPVADILSGRGIPFVFATGAGAGSLPAQWQGHCSVQKPVTVDMLANGLGRAIREQRGS